MMSSGSFGDVDPSAEEEAPASDDDPLVPAGRSASDESGSLGQTRKEHNHASPPSKSMLAKGREQSADQMITAAAGRFLTQINDVRAELSFKPWSSDKRVLEYCKKHLGGPLNRELCFTSDEITMINTIQAKAAAAAELKDESDSHKGKRKRAEVSKTEKKSRLDAANTGVDDDVELDDKSGDDNDDKDDQNSVDGDSSSNAWLKADWCSDVKELMPPDWFGPAKETPSESTESKTLREKDAPKWKKVPLIADEAARKRLLSANAARVKNGLCAGLKMPLTLNSKRELKVLKGKDKPETLLKQVLSKDIPQIITRDTDVLRVVMTLLNSWSTAEPGDVYDCLHDVVVPLLMDNNIRSTDSLQRIILNLAYNVELPDDLATTASTTSALPLVRYHLDATAQQKKLNDSMRKASSSLRPTTSSSSSSSLSFKSGRGKHRGRGGSRSWGSRPDRPKSTTSSGDNSSSTRGGKSGRGGRGGWRGNSGGERKSST
jgi:hypothetical protein